jgi:two-component system chemotaxis response regulator CheY
MESLWFDTGYTLKMQIEEARVLLVDDNDFMRNLVRRILLRLPVAQVHEASGAVEALRLLASTPVDVVLCDIGMEPVNGIAFLQHLRAGQPFDGDLAPLDPNTPVVMLTGHNEENWVLVSRKAGASGFLSKPVAPDLLKKSLQACLTR